jgi:hypothetical protein
LMRLTTFCCMTQPFPLRAQSHITYGRAFLALVNQSLNERLYQSFQIGMEIGRSIFALDAFRALVLGYDLFRDRASAIVRRPMLALLAY